MYVCMYVCDLDNHTNFHVNWMLLNVLYVLNNC